MTKLSPYKRAIAAVVVIMAIGIGVLVWQSAPDSEPDIPLTPATPTAPLVTEAPATPVIGGEAPAPQESCKALKIACDIGDVDACIEAKSRHCDLVDDEATAPSVEVVLTADTGPPDPEECQHDFPDYVQPLDGLHPTWPAGGVWGGHQNTSAPCLALAQNLIEIAHQAVGNRGKHNCDVKSAGDNCDRSNWHNAWTLDKACWVIGADLRAVTTWDHGRNVDHACRAANDWLLKFTAFDNLKYIHRAEYQIGILRDVFAVAKPSA